MRLRRFSQLGWLGCQDLAGFVMGSEVERVELGPPPVYEKTLNEALLEAAMTTGHLSFEVGPDGPVMYKIPGALLNVTGEWAKEMGYDVDELEQV